MGVCMNTGGVVSVKSVACEGGWEQETRAVQERMVPRKAFPRLPRAHPLDKSLYISLNST